GGEVGGETTLAVGDGDRRHAVGDEVDLARERRIMSRDLAEQVIDRALHAMARGLAGDHDGVRGEQGLHEAGVALREGRAVEARQDLGPEYRVVLGERVTALDLDARLRGARERMKQPGLMHDTGERVAVRAEQAVRWPQVQLVLAGALELSGVVQDLLA